MKDVIIFEAVIERIKSALKLKNDKELAQKLGLKPNTYYNRKTARSLPLEEIIRLASEHELSVDWVFFGIGNASITGEAAKNVAVCIDPKLIGQILMSLRAAFFGNTPINCADENKIPVICVLAGQIYNRVQFMKDSKHRSEKIRELSKDFKNTAEALARANLLQ